MSAGLAPGARCAPSLFFQIRGQNLKCVESQCCRQVCWHCGSADHEPRWSDLTNAVQPYACTHGTHARQHLQRLANTDPRVCAILQYIDLSRYTTITRCVLRVYVHVQQAHTDVCACCDERGPICSSHMLPARLGITRRLDGGALQT